MEKDLEKRYVCKLCNKSFFSREALVGHMRVHLAAKSVKKHVKIESDNMSFDGYVLRENPKKSWRFSGLKHKLSPEIEEVVKCYVCEREFGSPRSLHGHMRHHSKLERKGVHCQECGKAFKTLRALSGHMRLHSKKFSSGPNLGFLSSTNAETMNLVRRKRSNRVRYKVTPNCSFSTLTESLPDFEIDQEVEEVAMCLIMLSRDVHDFGDICSVCGYLCDHCICSEVKSMCQNKRIRSDGGNGLIDGKAVEEFYTCPANTQNKALQCCEYECEIVKYEDMKVEIEVETHNGSELMLSNAEANLGIHFDMNFNPNEAEPSQDFVEKVGSSVTELTVAESFKSTEAMIYRNNAEIGKPSCSDKPICSDSNFGMWDDVPKTEFKCKICSKILPTYQALGGHQTCHRASLNISFATALQNNTNNEHWADNQTASKLEHSDNSSEMEGITLDVDEASKRSKDYRCHICFKTFVSGRALGGHKRAHVGKIREEQSVAITQEASDMCAVFTTTNLAEMVDAETNSGAEFSTWWSQNSCHHESLVTLLAN